MQEIKVCKRGCGLYITYMGKDHDKRGSTGFFECDNKGKFSRPMVEHTYRRCDKLIKENILKSKEDDIAQTKLF